jgi:hypothetical protein
MVVVKGVVQIVVEGVVQTVVEGVRHSLLGLSLEGFLVLEAPAPTFQGYWTCQTNPYFGPVIRKKRRFKYKN